MALESARGDTTVKSSGGPTELPPQFGRYRVKQKLGGGGMGSVYLVENTELEREEALKVPHFEAGDDTQLRERFLREAKSAAKLDHANLCPVYDAGVRDGICYLTMRYLEGKLLTEYTGKAQPARKAVEIATKLAQALEAAHGKGVIHRDLKPSNIMMVAGVGPVVMDFGLAKLVRQPDKTLTQAGATIGTPAYMPPEQVHGDVEQMGPASDVYTLGVILYELLTGRLPFEGTTGAIFGKILYTEPPLPSALVPGLNPVLDGICRKAMAKAATDRYPSMKAFAAALVEYLRSTPATAGAGNLVSTAVDKAAIFQAPTVAPGPRVDGSTSFASTRSVEGGNRSLARPDSLPSGLADHPVYDNIRELGHGGMGVVYLAHNRLVDRDEVLKVLSPGLMGQAGIEERFLREIRAVAKLRHPNIVAAYIAFRLGESIVFAMEYIKGQDLSKLVKLKGPLPVGHACHFIQQAAQGLQHAFEQGMVHRDIKPGNLMLSRRGDSAVIKILDFGLAKAAREQEADTGLAHAVQMLGTPDYVAPEQIRNAQGADVRADIYSLGCTLYYLLTGGPPFQAASPYDLLQAHHSMYAKPLNLLRPEVPSELAAVVARMMAKEPEQRFQTPSAVAEALKPFGKLSSAEFKSTRPEPSGSKSTEVDESETYGLAVEEMPASPGRYSNLVKTVVATPSRTRRPSRIDVDKLDHLEPPPPAPSGAEGWSPAWQTLILAAPFIVILLGIVIYVVTDKGRIKSPSKSMGRMSFWKNWTSRSHSARANTQ
jgi:serine/threonine protein kinase